MHTGRHDPSDADADLMVLARSLSFWTRCCRIGSFLVLELLLELLELLEVT